ncbi:MAG TPA: nicotinate (nicotinamide) nucleotide adenylyltransferase, partial [Polyangiaceae bacterium]
DRVLVVPTFRHPFAKDLAPFEARARMLNASLGLLPRVEISRIEEELGGESKTLHTLQALHAKFPSWSLRLVMGGDLLAEKSKWYRFDEIEKLAPPLVIGREGFSGDGKSHLLPEISSTDVRAKIAARAWNDVLRVVPSKVVDLIREEGLYSK